MKSHIIPNPKNGIEQHDGDGDGDGSDNCDSVPTHGGGDVMETVPAVIVMAMVMMVEVPIMEQSWSW